ncbi:MAG TPA: DUF4129 domain-containing protein [Kineosporiaceae bacterium]|nr:DUF4129 domain-containing protein [Kineosporiaceae bacterium]
MNLQVPVQPDAEQGRAWARAELAGPQYEHASLLRRALEWLLDRLQDLPLPHGSGTAVTGTLLVAVLLALLMWAVRRAGGPLGRGRKATQDVFDDGTRSAAWHRAAADTAAAAGDLRTAVLERFRTVVRELEERAVLADQPGRTAGEAARAAADRLPALGGQLTAAARIFDDVRYGDRPATAAMDEALRELDAALRAERLVPLGSGDGA